MFSKYKISMLCIFLLAGAAQASGNGPLYKVKTGILPSGDFFSIYEASCPQNTAVSIASLDRRQRWCVESSGQLRCFRAAREAARYACSDMFLAGTLDDSGNYPAQ